MEVEERIAAARAIDGRHRLLADRILAEEPGVGTAGSDWQLITALRRWAYRNIRRQIDYATLLDQRPEFGFYGRDAADVFEAFAADAGGVLGGGCTYALMRLYWMFGFEALMIDCGAPNLFTRMSVLCNLGGTNDPLWAVQDPNYDFALATPEGGPIDIREVVRLLRLRRHDLILRADGPADACREIILLPEQLSQLGNDWTLDDQPREPLRTLSDGRAVFRSHMTIARYAERAASSMIFLREKGYPEDLLYFYDMIFGIYLDSNPQAAELFNQVKKLQSMPLEALDQGNAVAAEAPRPEVRSMQLEDYEGFKLDLDAYRRDGFFVIRNFFSDEDRDAICSVWQTFYDQALHDARGVGTTGAAAQDLVERPPEPILRLYRHAKLIELMRAIYGNDIAFVQQRVLIKDSHFMRGVPPHQDYSYYRGGIEKTGLFIPLTTCDSENGALHFMLGSHRFGYLGDRGYIPYERLVDEGIPGFRTVCPTLHPGDIALMDICLLHFSLNATSDAPRVYVNPYYQPATDGSYNELVSGEWKTDFHWKDHDIMRYFKTNAEIFGEEIESLKIK